MVNFRYERLVENDQPAYLLLRNMQGKLIVSYTLTDTVQTVQWSSKEHPSGVYIYTVVEPDGNTTSHKLVVL